MPRPVRRAGAAVRLSPLPVVEGLPPESSLVNLALLGAGERQPVRLQLKHLGFGKQFQTYMSVHVFRLLLPLLQLLGFAILGRGSITVSTFVGVHVFRLLLPLFQLLGFAMSGSGCVESLVGITHATLAQAPAYTPDANLVSQYKDSFNINI